MDTNLLKIFIAVADNESITLAANELGFTQSNVTLRIKQLEKNLGYSLFHRVPKGVVMTDKGTRLYKHAIEIVRKVEDAILDVQNEQEQKKLIIGSTDCNAVIRISSFITKLHEDYPNMQLEFITGTTKEITKMVLEYKVNIAFISSEPTHNELLILKKYEEELAILEEKNDKSQNVLLTFKEGSIFDEFLRKYYEKKGVEVEKSIAFGSLETILACVKAGMGKTLLPLKLVDKLGYKEELKITKLDKKIAYFPTCLVCRKDYQPKISEYLKEMVF
ncbi:LysR family transcriptional regulator [Halarcobacter bivalviorum]|uniref:LysR family transcriptional regulator n=1 Tax=Halarcobacter bivalviorum TaxID=663364 RepID=UPI00100BA533|nr:LysR family transcriptional regulator [Halarcobacter bivalviorum]RXK08126.1 LysR family transcriptional regulator [Halarcobacter bivalviorum]